MRDALKIFKLLGVPPRGLGLSKIETQEWGKRTVFDLFYIVYDEPKEVLKPFQLIFEDCTNVSWKYFEDQEEDWGEYAEILALVLETKDNHEAVILAIGPHVEFTVKYGSYTIKKDW